jgi:hypothetical protein
MRRLRKTSPTFTQRTFASDRDAGPIYLEAKAVEDSIGAGSGAPCKVTNFCGMQHALVSFARSACMVFSSLNH